MTKTGNTSITIKIESWARRARGADTVPIKVTEGLFTYVKVDADGTAATGVAGLIDQIDAAVT